MDAAHLLVLPLLGHVLLTLVVGLLTLRARIAAGKARKVRMQDIALNSSAWPEAARKLGNNFDNQFQVPMLAYAAVGLYIATGLADNVAVVLAFIFLAARVLHSIEHTGANRVLRRLAVFLVSFAAVVALWIWFAIRFYVTG